MPRRPKTGDVFTIPLPNGDFGVGQLIMRFEKARGYFYAVAFDDVVAEANPDSANIERAVASPPVLMALTMDTLLMHERWRTVANVEFDTNRIRFPEYKIVNGRRDVDVLDEQGRTRRKASKREASHLREQTFVAPIRLEKALSALKAGSEWDPDYSELLLATEAESSARSWVNSANV